MDSVTNAVTLSVTLCRFSMAAKSVTARLRQSQYQRESNRHRKAQGLKALHFANFPDCVTTNVTESVTAETPINRGVSSTLLHLLHLK